MVGIKGVCVLGNERMVCVYGICVIVTVDRGIVVCQASPDFVDSPRIVTSRAPMDFFLFYWFSKYTFYFI